MIFFQLKSKNGIISIKKYREKNSIMILFFYWSFFVLDSFFFIRFHLILFCLYIKYGTHSLYCCFFFFLFFVCFFSFNFVTQHFISLFFSRFSPPFFNCSFLILFLILFTFNFVPRYSISFVFLIQSWFSFF